MPPSVQSYSSVSRNRVGYRDGRQLWQEWINAHRRCHTPCSSPLRRWRSRPRSLPPRTKGYPVRSRMRASGRILASPFRSLRTMRVSRLRPVPDRPGSTRGARPAARVSSLVRPQHRAALVARWLENRLRERSLRQPADLCRERRWLEPQRISFFGGRAPTITASQ